PHGCERAVRTPSSRALKVGAMAKRRTKTSAKARKVGTKKRSSRAPRHSQPKARPVPTAPPSGPPEVAARTQVRVRMYRQGLGDCFLLALPKQDGSPFFLMIDCGVILGTEDAAAKMNRVVADIIGETNGRVDLLIVTHEHWDHVSGFNQASNLFVPANSDD